nr:MAG TPA: YaaC-like protein [Caudoviricetes sp.]
MLIFLLYSKHGELFCCETRPLLFFYAIMA